MKALRIFVSLMKSSMSIATQVEKAPHWLEKDNGWAPNKTPVARVVRSIPQGRTGRIDQRKRTRKARQIIRFKEHFSSFVAKLPGECWNLFEQHPTKKQSCLSVSSL